MKGICPFKILDLILNSEPKKSLKGFKDKKKNALYSGQIGPKGATYRGNFMLFRLGGRFKRYMAYNEYFVCGVVILKNTSWWS